ncbi:mucoidy inhibitor MuiA family protein [Winogradskyella aurantiaca]|uniref:mucoidy inhibitor MuiA family protein n=1 Tax=Winogradskyella aurantiaca TaxID=2219558 RepID=UPI000E1CA718|nr:mucoidy inhibitor MuiA family protein [Winogradskyella aurantiaca]
MKIALIIISLSFSFVLYAQEIPEKEVASKVNEVTIFLKDAQVTRKKTVALPKGISVVKFVKLSPFIKAKSVQLKTNSKVTVLAVNHKQNYKETTKASSQLEALDQKLKNLQDKREIEKTYLGILSKELSFMDENRDLSGKNEAISASNLQQSASYYSTRIRELKLKEVERNKNVRELNDAIRQVEKEIGNIRNTKEFPTGEIMVKVDCKNSTSVPMELSYVVKNASWFPTYDIRAKNIKEPVNLVYKATVQQDTKVDWNNAKVTFSTADPNISGVAPELKTYYLDYYTLPPTYGRLESNTISGVVMDANNNYPTPGVTVMVKETTIGTTTDFDGRFSITLPNDQSALVFSYIGFKTQTIYPKSNNIVVRLEEDAETLDEVVVVGYGSKKNDVRIRGASNLAGEAVGLSVEDSQSKQTIELDQIDNQTSVSFEIKKPYTIKSDNESYTVDMESYELPAHYQYFSVPKINNNAYLIANISDWEKYNLLEGEANVFFEETYVGKTLLDIRYAADTLQISLGRDKQVSVKREKLKEYTTKQFIGSKKEETRGYLTTVKNNKKEAINMVILDQIPISRLEEIEVSWKDISKGKFDKTTGEVKWEFEVPPAGTKAFNLQYSVKYPKSKSLIIE